MHACGESALSADKVDHDQMQDNVSKDEVGKRSLWGDVQELIAVLGVGLDTEANCEGGRK